MDSKVLDDVHAFWFGPLAAPDAVPFDKVPMWFGATPEIDELIRQHFADAIDSAARDHHDLDALTPRQKLGLVILLDQMTRNTGRGSAATYEHDATARALSKAIIANGLGPFGYIERMFVILPLGHGEDIGEQDTAVTLLETEIVPFVDADHPFWARVRKQAAHHRETIARFGRFPHRNAVLGRQSTDEELAYIRETAG